MESFKTVTLGQTGIKVGRLGVAASYGAPAKAFEGAFERGCNYFYDIFHVRYNAAHRGAENEVFAELQDEARPAVVSYTATRGGQLLNPKKMPPREQPMRASDCYRFALSNPAVDVCMCGPKNTAQMREALGSLDLGPLNENELKRVRKIGDWVHVHSGKFF
jgi:aryl-alcohol dehydrogenase-like predicted oxidoreductase